MVRNEVGTTYGIAAWSGKSNVTTSLAAATGRSYGFIHRILSENGVTLRGRGGATRGKAKAKR